MSAKPQACSVSRWAIQWGKKRRQLVVRAWMSVWESGRWKNWKEWVLRVHQDTHSEQMEHHKQKRTAKKISQQDLKAAWGERVPRTWHAIGYHPGSWQQGGWSRSSQCCLLGRTGRDSRTPVYRIHRSGGGRWVTSDRLTGRICVMCAYDKKGNWVVRCN